MRCTLDMRRSTLVLNSDTSELMRKKVNMENMNNLLFYVCLAYIWCMCSMCWSIWTYRIYCWWWSNRLNMFWAFYQHFANVLQTFCSLQYVGHTLCIHPICCVCVRCVFMFLFYLSKLDTLQCIRLFHRFGICFMLYISVWQGLKKSFFKAGAVCDVSVRYWSTRAH